MKIIKYIGSILFDIGKVIVGICAVLLLLGIVALIAMGILYVICGTSALVCKLFGNNPYVLCGCIVLWLVGLISLFEGINPIKGFGKEIVNIKNYFINKWNEIN